MRRSHLFRVRVVFYECLDKLFRPNVANALLQCEVMQCHVTNYTQLTQVWAHQFNVQQLLSYDSGLVAERHEAGVRCGVSTLGVAELVHLGEGLFILVKYRQLRCKLGWEGEGRGAGRQLGWEGCGGGKGGLAFPSSPTF